MEYIIIGIITIILLVVLKLLINVNVKKIKQIAENEELNNLTKKLPDNKKICKEILEKVNNKNLTIEETENTDCFYFIVTNKIILNKDTKYYTRIQTIAHECIHSIQDKKLLWFNNIFSNLLNLYMLIIFILTAIGIIKNSMLQMVIFLLLTMVFYFVRSFLEIDAMTKAKFLAKDYLEDKKIYEKEEINKIIEGYEELNNIGIKYVCYKLLSSKLFIFIIYVLLAIVRHFI